MQSKVCLLLQTPAFLSFIYIRLFTCNNLHTNAPQKVILVANKHTSRISQLMNVTQSGRKVLTANASGVRAAESG